MNDELTEAVDALTNEREVTTIIKDDNGDWLGFHNETHPSLLTLLLVGTGTSRGPKSAETPLPIDADALELWGQVHDLIRVWCKKLRVTFTDDLNDTVRRWHSAHNDGVHAGRIGAGTDQDVTRMVQGWVRMIDTKFNPQNKAEWTGRCVASIPITDEAGEPLISTCGARRINLNGSEAFAIEVNYTTATATCRACGTEWHGLEGFKELRYLTNLDTPKVGG